MSDFLNGKLVEKIGRHSERSVCANDSAKSACLKTFHSLWSAPPPWAGGNISYRDAEFLHQLLHREKPSLVLEIGTASGFSTAMICRSLAELAESSGGDPDYRVVSYDAAKDFYGEPSKRVGDAAREMLNADLLAHVEFRNPQNAADAARDFAADGVSFCFIDACHRHPWPALDLLALSEIVRPGGLVVLHDINLPCIALLKTDPDNEVWGVNWLFSELDLEKEVSAVRNMFANIGAVRMPHDKRLLRRKIIDIIHSHPWECRVDAKLLARLALPRADGLIASLLQRFRQRNRPAQIPSQLRTLLSRVGLGMEAGGDPESLRRDLEQIKQMLGSEVPKTHFWISGMEMELSLKHGWNLIRAGEWTDALKVADETLSQTGNEVSLLMRGCALNGLSRYAEAEESLRKFTPTGTGADQYVPVELARAVMHQQRHDEAEEILLESLSQAAASSYVELAMTQHTALLRDVLVARGDWEKAKRTVDILKGLMPDEPALAVFAEYEKRGESETRGLRLNQS